MKKRIFCFLLCAIVLVTSWMNVAPSTVAASSDEYTTNDVYDSTTLVENLKNGGKVVLLQDITTGQLTIEKDSTIDLNGYKLTVDGIVISEGKTFTIMDSQYTDDNPGSGKLTTKGMEYMAGIQTTDATLIIESGVVEAIGNSGGAGIGGNNGELGNDAGKVVINGGVVTASGEVGGAGIGGGDGGSLAFWDLYNKGIEFSMDLLGDGGHGGEVIINGGNVRANGGKYHAPGIGGGTGGRYFIDGNIDTWGKGGNNGIVTINGGSVCATGCSKYGLGSAVKGPGIGCGYGMPSGSGGSVIINDGIVEVIAAPGGYDIGGISTLDTVDGNLFVNGGKLVFRTSNLATNMSNISFKNCIIGGENQYRGSYDDNGYNVSIQYTITFKDGDKYEIQYVYGGQTAIAPNWSKPGYSLTWDRTLDNINESMTVNAVWTPNIYTVLFKNGEVVIDTQQVEYQKSAIEPTQPVKEGYAFDGWDQDFSCVVRNMIVNAKWKYGAYSIFVLSSGGGEVSGGGAKCINENAKIVATPNAGYQFDGWYENGVKVSDNKSYSFIVTSNRNLEARFTKIKPNSIIIDGEKQLDDMFIVECGKTLELTVLPNPYDAIIDETKVQWSTSDSTVATVENGIIRGIKQGQVTIMALYDGKQASCIITVIPERTISCDECFGIGYEYIGCEKCSYDGKMPCPTCEGKGSIPKYEDCSKCGGDGKIFYSRTCEVCNGSGLLYNSAIGMYTCTECFEGTKYLNKTCSCIDGKVESGYPCEYCDGNKKIICKYCNGKKNYDRECEKCNATGEQKKAIYKIEYHANGGTNSPYAQIKTEDIKLQISNQIPVRENHIFLGWALKSSADEADYLPGDYILGNEPKILYAVWKEENILTSIGVTRMPFKVNYTEGEIFDSTGLIITAYFSSGVTQIISNYEITGYESTPGEKRIKVTYNDKTVEFSVVVKSKTVLSSISIAQMPYKVRYTEGEKFDSTGLIVTAHYSNNTTKNITGYGITGYESTPGEKKIKITYDNKTAYFTVTVKSKTLTSISIAQMPHKLNYVEGEVFKKDGLVVKANYSNNTSSNITTYQLTGYESTPGEKKIKITYDGKIAYFTITVKPKVPQAVTSGTYKVSGNVISKVTIGTTIKKLVSSINESKYVKVFKNQTEVKSDETISTGMMVNIMDGSTVAKSYKIIVTGDVNGDGNATVTDMLAIKANILGKNKLSGEYATAADTSGDNAISITDFIQLKAKVLGKGSITAR